MELRHEVSGYNAGGPGLSPDGVDQDTLKTIQSLVNEVKYVLNGVITPVKQYLVLLVLPLVGQILNSQIGELVLYLGAAAVYDFGHFVRRYELMVFGRKSVADEKAIYDFDGSNHVVIFYIHCLGC
jgi:hypothetical protein